MTNFRAVRFFKEFLYAPDSALNLALFRILVFSLLLFGTSREKILRLTDLDPGLVYVFPGIAYLKPFIFFDHSSMAIAITIFYIATIFAIFGFYTRTSAFLAALLATSVLGLPQFYGKIFHSQQHLIRFGLILAASPSGDVLSIDAWIKRLRTGASISIDSLQTKYGLPIRMIWLCFPVFYFFPGLYKLSAGGLDWIFSDNLRNRMYLNWFFYKDGIYPWFRVDHYPWLIHAMAAATIIFEVTFILAVFNKASRFVYVMAAVLFHYLIYIYMDLEFFGLMACYLIFIDWRYVWRWLRPFDNNLSSYPIESARTSLCAGVGLTVLALSFGFGAIGLWSWPFSTYPEFFNPIINPITRFATFEIRGPGGESLDITPSLAKLQSLVHPNRWVARAQRIARMNPIEAQREALSIWRQLSRWDVRLASAKQIEVFVEKVTVVPGLEKRNPLRRKLLVRVDL